jgi:hypothetical protein
LGFDGFFFSCRECGDDISSSVKGVKNSEQLIDDLILKKSSTMALVMPGRTLRL